MNPDCCISDVDVGYPNAKEDMRVSAAGTLYGPPGASNPLSRAWLQSSSEGSLCSNKKGCWPLRDCEDIRLL